MTDITKSLIGIGIGISFVTICAIIETISPIPLKYDQRKPKEEDSDRRYYPISNESPKIVHKHYHIIQQPRWSQYC